ncbi:MAG: hypothetical protein HOW73_09295 [Polyangiaceae bacterium]|nr:hypothetical protein [Polyangiaceae bacterium]
MSSDDRDDAVKPGLEAPSMPEVGDPAVALDEESPSQVLKTFAALLAFAGVLCLVPRQWVSAGLLFAGAAIAVTCHLRIEKRGR